MAEKEKISAGSERSTLSITQSGVAVPPAGGNGVLQDGGLSLTILDSGGDKVVQPFPRSPKLLHRLAETGHISQEQLSKRVQELQGEQSKAADHIQSLKKRKADLSRSTEVMKQQVRERYDAMRSALTRDEQAVLDSLEQDRRETSARLDQVVKTWEQHLGQVSRSISATHRALDNSHQKGAPLGERTTQPAHLSAKKPDASEAEIRLNEGRFERLLRTLRSISKQLKAQLQRKTLLLDSSPVVIDRQTCHGQIAVTAEGRGAYLAAPSQAAPERPLQFDKVCCALGSAAVASRQSYWEADVRCCGAWAVGVAYGCLERKGRDKGSKLGRNRNSWCVELRDGRLSAWHNDRNVLCETHGQAAPGKVGVWVDYQKGQLVFYDAERMKVLQQFSAAMTPVFDRAHHQFTEPLYPVLRFLTPPPGGAHAWPNHIQICDLTVL